SRFPRRGGLPWWGRGVGWGCVSAPPRGRFRSTTAPAISGRWSSEWTDSREVLVFCSHRFSWRGFVLALGLAASGTVLSGEPTKAIRPRGGESQVGPTGPAEMPRWLTDYEEAKKLAQRQRKPLFVVFRCEH